MPVSADVIVIGGGLAGLTSAIHLSNKGLSVIVIERQSYPKHKVCGEYISKEVLPYFEYLGIDISGLGIAHINRFRFSSRGGKTVDTLLPLGGISISRYTIDHFLAQNATSSGSTIITEKVENIIFDKDIFKVHTTQQTYTSTIVIGAYGKRSNLDQALKRNFIFTKTPWVAAKAHYRGNFPDDLVGLYHFKGGYCGVSKVENDAINICYIFDQQSLSKYKNIEEHLRNVLYNNPRLREIFDSCEMIFPRALSISQISFEKKERVENHILMIGDSAGLIHPLCGNGMAMAIHSAKIVSENVIEFMKGKIKTRKELENKHKYDWEKTFMYRIKFTGIMNYLFYSNLLSNLVFSIVAKSPWLLRQIIKNTHGKPIEVQEHE